MSDLARQGFPLCGDCGERHLARGAPWECIQNLKIEVKRLREESKELRAETWDQIREAGRIAAEALDKSEWDAANERIAVLEAALEKSKEDPRGSEW